MDASGKWHFEVVSLDLSMLYRIRDVLYTGQTAYQKVDILQSEEFGRCLVLDGKTQSTEFDEHIYHECLVHPALLSHPDPKSVFIGGGGEGTTLREVLAHRSVEKVTMLDLDKEVVDLCRRFLPQHHQGSFDDSRVELLHQDARGYLAETSDTFDVIVLDLVDPMEGGPAYLLYTREFYRLAAQRLNPGGILVTQSGPAGLINYTECFTPIAHTLGDLFPQVQPYTVYVPSFITPWGFVMAVSDPATTLPTVDAFHEVSRSRLSTELRYLDGITCHSLFTLPRYLREGIAFETRTVSDNSPVFMV